MLFNIEFDNGDEIVGYVVTDGVSASLDLQIFADGKECFEIRADQLRPALVAAGRHQNGACGFTVSNLHIPDLAEVRDLEIREKDSNLLIYRRPAPQYVNRKIFRLETHLFPLWRFDNSILQNFQYSSHNIESFGRETTTQLFLLNNVASIYLSGRVLYKNFAHYVESGFETLALVQDPYEELAERLLILAQSRKAPLSFMSERDSVSLIPAMAFIEDVDTENAAAVHKAFKSVSDEAATVLADPLVRQLTTNLPGEMAGKNATSAALDVLSRFSIVGRRAQADKFIDACGQFIGIDSNSISPISQFGKVTNLAEILRQSRHAGYLIEKDRELYAHISAASDSVSAKFS